MRHITLLLAMSFSSACGADLSTGEVNTAADATIERDATPTQLSQELLPSSFKGYELYAWNESSEVLFTLITGTNRLKTAEEIRTAPAVVDANRFVVVRGKGAAALRTTLQRIPADTALVPRTLSELPPLDARQQAEVAAVVEEFR